MEGPQVSVYAKRLRPWAGRIIAGFGGERAGRFDPFVGRPLPGAVSFGKLLFLPDERVGRAIRLHCLMFGDLRTTRDRPGKRLTLRIDLEGGDYVALYLGAATSVPVGEVVGLPVWRDAMSAEFDATRTLAHATRNAAGRPACDVLLGQGFFPGFGNKVKNEGLWRARTHPLRPWRGMTSARRRRVLDGCVGFATDLRDAFASGTPRDDGRGGREPRYDVYRRKLCPRCDTTIEHLDLGDPPRRCHLCPRCQPPPH